MKEILKYIMKIIEFICIILLAICVIQNSIILLFINGWIKDSFTISDYFNFCISLIGQIGTIILGIITINQTKYANKISNKLLDKELLNECCCIQLIPKMDLVIKHNDNNKITMSAHHKLDSGATIATEKTDAETDKLNEYYIKFYFKDISKGIINKIQIKDLLCVQEPLKQGGLCWEDIDNNDPIPCGLNIDDINDVQLNWISDNEFYTHLKIYSPYNGLFSHMIENKACSCLMFNYILTSITNVQSKILFTIWFQKNEEGQIEIIHTNTNIIYTKLIK